LFLQEVHFPAIYPLNFGQNCGITRGSRGNGIAGFWLFESGNQKDRSECNDTTASPDRVTHCATLGGVIEEQYLRAPKVTRAIRVDHVRLLTEASEKLLCLSPAISL